MPRPRIANRPRRCKGRRRPAPVRIALLRAAAARAAVLSSAHVGAFDSVRRGPSRASATVRFGVAALIAALAGCFKPDYLDYAACATTEACRDAGLDACVLLPTVPDQRGFCAAACSDDSSCPSGQDGDAAPTCLAVADAGVCGLDCAAPHTCPSGYVCRAVTDAAATLRMLCFPGPEATP